MLLRPLVIGPAGDPLRAIETTMSMPWIKLHTSLLNDPRLSEVEPLARLRFYELMMLAGQCDAGGALVRPDGSPMSVANIAWALRVGADQIASDITALCAVGLIDRHDETVFIAGFEESQGQSQSEKRAAWAERQARRRDSKPASENVTRDSRVTERDNVTSVTPLEGEGDKEREGEEEKREKREEGEDRESSDSLPAPDSPPSMPKPKSRKSTADERSSHPAILAVFHVTGKMPQKDIYGPIISVLGQSPDEIKLKSCWEAWRVRGYSPTNYAWATEWYLQGIPAQRQNYPARASPGPPESNGDGMTREQRLLAQTLAKVQAQNGEFT